MTTSTSNVQSSIEALLNEKGSSPFQFRSNASVTAERGMQFEQQLSAARQRSGSDRALDRQNAAERAAQDAARRRSTTARDRADAADEKAADARAADARAADRKADEKAADRDARAEAIRKGGSNGAGVDPAAEQRYHTADEKVADIGRETPADEEGPDDSTAGQAVQMDALAQVLAAEALAARQIAQALAGGDADAAAKLPTVTSIETTSGPDGLHTRLSVELALDAQTGAAGPAGASSGSDDALNALLTQLAGDDNEVLAGLLGLKTEGSVAAAAGVKGTADSEQSLPGTTKNTLPEGVSMTTGQTPAQGPGTTSDAVAAELAKAAAAGMTQTGTSSRVSEQAATGGQSTDTGALPATDATSAATGASAGASTGTDPAAVAPMPDRIMVNGQWMNGAEASSVIGGDASGTAGKVAGVNGAGASGAFDAEADADAQSQAQAGATAGATDAQDAPENTGSATSPGDGFTTQLGQAQQTQQASTPATVNGTGYSTAAAETVAEQVGQQIAAQLRTLKEGSHRAVIRLSPEDLGDVTVTLSVHNGDVRVDLVAAPAALTQLQAGLNDLRDQMNQAGLNLADVQMQASADTSAGTGGGSQPQPNYQPRSDLPGTGVRSSGTPTTTATPMTGAAAGNGNLDLMI